MELNIADLGKRIVEHRRPMGVREAAKTIGIGSATLSRIENGQVPDLETFAKICKWLGEDPRLYLGFSHNSESSPVATVHLRKSKTTSIETATALGAMIIAVQNALISKENL